MDFLSLFLIYVLFVLISIVLVCKYSNQEQTPFGQLFNFFSKAISPWIPQWLQIIMHKAMHRLFHQRTNMFVYLHLVLEAAVYGEFTFEVFGYCRKVDTTLASLSVPYVLLAVQTYLFYLCCTTDPGTITRDHCAQVYPYDGVMFHPGLLCPTCSLVKPARSKHCRVCNRCVQRFDHHCVWVNNCIGAHNTKHFLLYLLSVCAMAGDITLLTADMLFHAVVRSGLLQARYLDEQGQEQPADLLFVVQHLFLTFPRIIFMLGFLLFLFVLLAGYTMFHLYLALVNQTSNEWYKRKGSGCQHCHPSPKHLRDPPARRFYSRGVLRNLGEVFFPPLPVYKKDN